METDTRDPPDSTTRQAPDHSSLVNQNKGLWKYVFCILRGKKLTICKKFRNWLSLRIGDMRRVVVGFATDVVDIALQWSLHHQEPVETGGENPGRDASVDSVLCLLWHRHQSSSPPLPSSARLSSAWTQNYSLVLRSDCLIVHWRFWPLVFCGSITVFSLFSAACASKQFGLCDCWGDDRMPADCDDRSSSSDPHHPTYPGEARCSAACRCWPSAGAGH